jgi:mannosyltransferase
MTAVLSTGAAALPINGRHRRRDAAVLGVTGALVSFAFSWVPSLWFDETATVVAATRSWAELWYMLHTIDAVHGLYYALMHVWFDLVGYTPLTLRLPSAIAAGGAVALTVLAVSRISTRRIAIITGILLILLPRFAWAGDEGRSYAFTILASAAITLLLVIAVQSPTARVWHWIVYGVLCAVSIYLFAFFALVVLAHAVTMIWLARRAAVPRATVVAYFVTVALAALATIPLVPLVTAQSGQVRWISSLDWNSFWNVLVGQYFVNNLVFAIIAWPLAIAGIVLSHKNTTLGNQTLRALAVPMVILPTVLLLVATAVAVPLYTPRYLTMTLPAFAMLLAVALDRLPTRRLTAAVLVVLTLTWLPTYVADHTENLKHDTVWASVAASLSELRAVPGSPGGIDDGRAGVVFGPARLHNLRTIAYSYPDAFAGLKDVTLVTPYWESRDLWEVDRPLAPSLLTGLDAVWVVKDAVAQDPRIEQALNAAGFTLDQSHDFTYNRLELWIRR